MSRLLIAVLLTLSLAHLAGASDRSVGQSSEMQSEAAKTPLANHNTFAAPTIPAPKEGTETPDDSTYARRDYAIRLQRKAGRVGSEYSVTILGDRSVTFVASSSKLDDSTCCDIVRKKTLSTTDYDVLVKQIDVMKFFELKEGYPDFDGNPIFAIDASVITTTVAGPYGSHMIERSEEPCETGFRREYGTAPMIVAVEPQKKPESKEQRIRRIIDTNPMARATPAPRQRLQA